MFTIIIRIIFGFGLGGFIFLSKPDSRSAGSDPVDLRDGAPIVSLKVPEVPEPVSEFAAEFRGTVCDDKDKKYNLEFLACATRIGSSIEGRALSVFDIGAGEEPDGGDSAKIFFIGGLHTETEDNTYLLAGKVLKYFLGRPGEIPRDTTLYILPKANPDGAELHIHNNARGVDLNRNWPSSDWRSDPYHPTYGYREGAGGTHPLSEPETKAIYDFILEEAPDIIFVWHSRAGTVEDNNIGIADSVAEVYAKASGYMHIEEWPYYEVTGGFSEAMRELGVAEADIELKTRTNSEFEVNLRGVKAVLDYISTN